MAKKFIIKEEYSLDEAGPSFMDRLRGAAAGFRKGTTPESTPSPKTPAEPSDTARPAAADLAAGSATPGYKSGPAIQSLWKAYWGLRKELGNELLFGGDDEKQDKTKFAREYLNIVHASDKPETPEQAIERAVEATREASKAAGRGPAEPEAPSATDYTKMDAYGKTTAAIKDLGDKLKEKGIEDNIINKIKNVFLTAARQHRTSDTFVLKEARAKDVLISNVLKSLTPKQKKDVIEVIKDWSEEVHKYDIVFRTDKLPSVESTPAEEPPVSAEISPTTEPEARINPAGAEIAPEAEPMNWDKLTESLGDGLFDKFLKRKKQLLVNTPYKMVGKNKFKLL